MVDLFERGPETRDWFQRVFGFEEDGQSVRRLFQVVGERHDTVLIAKPHGAPHRQFHVGLFETPTLTTLRGRLLSQADVGEQGGLQFAHVVGDIVDVHKNPEFADAVIQVASQFNCLEMPNPYVTPEEGITGYCDDGTQGPTCAMMCPAATVFRNYFVNGVGQTANNQLDMLTDVAKALAPEEGGDPYWFMQNGYCFPWGAREMKALNDRLLKERGLVEKAWAALRVGVQWDTEVKSGHHVCQVYSSGLPIAYAQKPARALMEPLAEIVLCATYEATFTAAALLAKKRRARVKLVVLFLCFCFCMCYSLADLFCCVLWCVVVCVCVCVLCCGVCMCRVVFTQLTKVGGGVFGNSPQWIVNAINKALCKFASHPLDVYLLHRSEDPFYLEHVELALKI